MNKPKIDRDGIQKWRNEQGLIHREDGPAFEYKNGSKFWYINGNLHREDGPAVEWSDGDMEWWLNSKEYTKDEYKFIQFMKGVKVNV